MSNQQTLGNSNYRLLWDLDVVVVGGGSAGAMAAIAAARQGAKVALVDKLSFLGGTGTAVLDTFYGFYTPGAVSRKVVGGIADEIINGLMQRNAAIKRPNTYGAGTGITYDPDVLKVVWEDLATKAGVKLLFNTLFLDTLMEDNRVIGIVVGNKAGLWKLTARVIIDASGDGDVAFRAGASYEDGSDAPLQSLTTTFRLLNVNVEKARSVKKDKLWALMREANASGHYHLPREEGSVHITPSPGVMATNMVRINLDNPVDPVKLSQAEVAGRQQALEYYRFLKDMVPGFEEASLAGFSTFIGVRESRRIKGRYWLTRDDVLSCRKFKDAIAMCGAPIEDHHSGKDTRWEYLPEGKTYDIPYRALLPLQVEGLIIAGRCLSASHDAHASVRSMAQCMAMGQAAGFAAAQALNHNNSPANIDTTKLQHDLIETGVILDTVEAE